MFRSGSSTFKEALPPYIRLKLNVPTRPVLRGEMETCVRFYRLIYEPVFVRKLLLLLEIYNPSQTCSHTSARGQTGSPGVYGSALLIRVKVSVSLD